MLNLNALCRYLMRSYTFEGGWSERLVPAGSGKIKLIDAFGQDWDYEITTVEEGESALSKIKQL